MHVRVECGVAWRYRLDGNQQRDVPPRCDVGSHRGNRTPERSRSVVGTCWYLLVLTGFDWYW